MDIELEQDLLLVTVRGSASYDAALRLFIQVFDHAAASQIGRVLVNGLTVDGALAAHERYRLGIEVAKYLARRRQTVKLALVGVPPAVNGYGIRVARNRGIDARVFPTLDEATGWLNEVPGQPLSEVGELPPDPVIT